MCDAQFWRNVVFINNFFGLNLIKYCWIPSWYLAVDLQMWVTAPFVMYFYITMRKRKHRPFIFIFLLLVVYIVTYITCWYWDIVEDPYRTPGTKNAIIYYDHYFANPFCRLDIFYIGMAFGCFYKECKLESYPSIEKVKKWYKDDLVRWTHYIVGFFLVNFTMFIIYPI